MRKVTQAPIGVFDSGVGGLTVTRAIVRELPCESLLYFGDTARVPYGNKSPATIQRYSLNIANRLVNAGVKAIVVACNTASAMGAVESISGSLGVEVMGVIEPVAALAASHSQAGCIGVIGTRGTVASGAYEAALRAHDPNLTIHSVACPLFVPLAEEGWREGEVPRMVAQSYLKAFSETQIDTLILGCTHYPLLAGVIEDVIADVTGRDVAVLDSATATARLLKKSLKEAGTERRSEGPAEHRFWVTDSIDAFSEVSELFFGGPVGDVEHVDL